MKKILMLLVLLGLAGSAGYIYWQRQAKFLERDIASTIERFNHEVKAQTGITPVEYKGITLRGFPFSIALTFHEPVIRLPLSHWIRDPEPDMEWVEEHRFHGDITLSADWKVTRYTLLAPAGIESVSLINGKPELSRRSTATTPLQCSLSLNMIEAFDKLWQPLETLKLAFENITLLHDVTCGVSGYRLTSADNGQTIQEMADGRFSLELEKQHTDKNLELSLSLKLEKYRAHDLNDRYYRTLFTAFPELERKTRKGLISLQNFSLYGEQNIMLDLRYAGPPKWMMLQTTFSLQAPRLEIRNALYAASAKILLDNRPLENGHRELVFDIDGTASVTPAYEQMARKWFGTRLAQTPSRIGIGAFMIDTALLPPDRINDFANDLFPRLTDLSPLHLRAQGVVGYDPDSLRDPLPSPVDLRMDSARLKSAAWQLALTGHGSYARERLLPTLDLRLRVKDGDSLFAQAGNKLIMLEKWRQQQRIRPPVLITNPYLIDLKRFVDAVAKGRHESLATEIQTLGDPDFHITFQNFLPRINGLELSEILLLYNELLLPHFHTHQSTYATPPSTYQPQ